MRSDNADVPGEHRIEFRVGINLGDIMIDGDDIHGDGVNICSAGPEAMAEPETVRVSAGTWEQARGRGCSEPMLGEHQLKNIERPVRVFRIGGWLTCNDRRDKEAVGASG